MSEELKSKSEEEKSVSNSSPDSKLDSTPEKENSSEEKLKKEDPQIISDPTKEKNQKNQKKKKIIFYSLFGLLSFISIFVMVYYFLFSDSFFTVKVIDKNTKKELTGVSVAISNEEKKTDSMGKARFDNLEPGENQIVVDLEGYLRIEENTTLKRGNNGEYIIELDLILINISGVLYDYVDKEPVTDVTLTLSDKTVQTDSEGKFLFQEVLPGAQEIKITKESYLDRTVQISGLSDTALGDMFLVPSNLIVFVSNRDGDKAVYKSYVNGENIEKLWANKKGFDDYNAVLSPNKEYLVFLTNRDDAKDEYGEYKNYLYLNTFDGLNLRKISEDSGSAKWLEDNSGFIYYTNDYDNDTNSYNSSIKNYDIATNKLKELFRDEDFESKSTTASASQISSLEVAANDKIVFNVNNWNESGKQGIYRADSSGENLTKLTDKYVYSFYLNSDKTKVQYMYYQNALPERYEIDIASGEEVKLELEPRSGMNLGQGYYSYEEKISPQGDLKAYIDYRDGKNDLYISDLDDANERRLSEIGGVSFFEFSENGKYLTFYVDRYQNETAVYIIGLAPENEPLKVTDVTEFVGIVD